MNAPYPAYMVANSFIDLYTKDKYYLTQLKLLKIIYIAHAFYLLKNKNKKLIKEPFEAWGYGPVIRDLYFEHLRFFESCQIDRLLGDKTEIVNREDEKFISQVFNFVSDMTLSEVMDFTHGDAWKNAKSYISDESICQEFKKDKWGQFTKCCDGEKEIRQKN